MASHVGSRMGTHVSTDMGTNGVVLDHLLGRYHHYLLIWLSVHVVTLHVVALHMMTLYMMVLHVMVLHVVFLHVVFLHVVVLHHLSLTHVLVHWYHASVLLLDRLLLLLEDRLVISQFNPLLSMLPFYEDRSLSL